MERLPIGVDVFSAENIRNCEEHVFSMQRRLDKAVADNDKGGIRETFDLLTKRSRAVRILATWRITQRNQGRHTAGVDGIAMPKGETRGFQSQLRHKIMAEIDIGKRPDTIKRIYIPKSNGKKQPLGMPTLHDRIVQEILRIGLEPIVEYHFHDHSYGFRPRRGCQDAMSQLFVKLAKEDRPKYVIEGDIKRGFDSVNHDHIIKTLESWRTPKWATEVILRMLKAEIFYNGEIYDSETGVPQGGVISPLLANVALTTLDNFCDKYAKGKRSNPMVRYADDFVIVARNEPEAEEIKGEITEHLLKTTGLTVSEEKTNVTHINKGFNFLGFNFRKYKTLKEGGKVKYTLSIQPQKEKVSDLLKSCKEILDSHKNATQRDVIKLLTPKLIGWAMYYRHVVSTRTFYRVDGKLWEMLYRWAKRRHPNKSKGWIIKRYFRRTEQRKLHFVDIKSNTKLPFIPKTPIKRFVKVNNNYRVYDRSPETIEYWEKREFLNAYQQIESVKRKTLFQKQKGKCPYCKGVITRDDIYEQGTHIHHVVSRSQGGDDGYSNLRLVHIECHREIHARQRYTN